MPENILQKLSKSQERFDLPETELLCAILQSIQEGVLFIQTDGQIPLINAAARKILKLPQNASLSIDIFPDEYFGFSLRESLKLGASHHLIYRSFGAQELEIHTRFLCEGPALSHGLLITFKDLTEKQTLLTTLHRNDRMRNLGEMVASTTHEIRNSLGGIRGYASLLYRDLSLSPSLQDMAHYIIEGTKALEKLVARILGYARPIQVSIQSVEMGSFLRQFIQWVKIDPGCPENIQWEKHIPQDPLIAPIDPQMLRSALLNLIFNSFQAMPRGGCITIALLKMESCYQIAISDTGIGMDAELLQKIFSPFFTTKQGGSGLGLTEVQKIIQAHYGTIDVRSFPQKGTTFTITLPLRRS